MNTTNKSLPMAVGWRREGDLFVVRVYLQDFTVEQEEREHRTERKAEDWAARLARSWAVHWSRDKEGPYNLALHNHLILAGYEHSHVEADVDDVGGPESGPIIRGFTPAYDVYLGEDEFVYSSASGELHREPHDPEAEDDTAEQMAACLARCAADPDASFVRFEAYLGDNEKIGAAYHMLEYIRENNHAGWDGYTAEQRAAVAFFFEDVMRYAQEAAK